MRIEAVNSYLSSMPIMEHQPVGPVARQYGQAESVEQFENTKQTKSLVFAYDTYGKAEACIPSVCPHPVKISAYEQSALLRLIESQKSRKDIVLQWFPALMIV